MLRVFSVRQRLRATCATNSIVFAGGDLRITLVQPLYAELPKVKASASATLAPKIAQPSEGLLLPCCYGRHQLKTSAARAHVGCPRQPTKAELLSRIPPHARCRSAGSCVSLPTNTSVPVEKLHAALSLQRDQHKKAIKKSQPVGARVARKINTPVDAKKKHGRPSSSRRRFTELRRREPAGRPAEPLRRGQALRARPRTLVTILPIEPVSHNNAAAGRRFRRRRFRRSTRGMFPRIASARKQFMAERLQRYLTFFHGAQCEVFDLSGPERERADAKVGMHSRLTSRPRTRVRRRSC